MTSWQHAGMQADAPIRFYGSSFHGCRGEAYVDEGVYGQDYAW